MSAVLLLLVVCAAMPVLVNAARRLRYLREVHRLRRITELEARANAAPLSTAFQGKYPGGTR